MDWIDWIGLDGFNAPIEHQLLVVSRAHTRTLVYLSICGTNNNSKMAQRSVMSSMIPTLYPISSYDSSLDRPLQYYPWRSVAIETGMVAITLIGGSLARLLAYMQHYTVFIRERL